MTDRLVLAMDGSTGVCAAAVLRRCATEASGERCWEVVAKRSEAEGRSQARLLLNLVDTMLREIQATPGSLGAIVVGTGPGTFTGVRIAVATARALSLALSLPVLGVSTLGALAAKGATLLTAGACNTGAEESGHGQAAGRSNENAVVSCPPAVGLLIPAVDARRDQVFYAIYEAAGEPQLNVKPFWARSAEFGVCDRGAFGGMVAGEMARRLRMVGGNCRRAMVVCGDQGLVGRLPEEAVFADGQVEAEGLVVGQEWLREPTELPQGAALTPWLENALVASPATARWDEHATRPGAAESVKPVYVRPPDADVHIKRMKDPWAGTSKDG